VDDDEGRFEAHCRATLAGQVVHRLGAMGRSCCVYDAEEVVQAPACRDAECRDVHTASSHASQQSSH